MLIYFLYLAIALLGLLFLAATFLVGEIADAFDVDAGEGVGPFNGKVIAVALTAFGATGLIATYLNTAPLLSALLAAASALLFGAAAWWLVAFFYRQQATTSFSLQELRGRLAQVSVAIPADGLGYVVVRDATGSRQLLARSTHSTPIPTGHLVRITDIVGTTVVVEPTEVAAHEVKHEGGFP